MLGGARHIALAAFLGFAAVTVGLSVALRVAENPSAEMIGVLRLGLFGMLATGAALLGAILIRRITDSRRGAARVRG